MVSFMDAHGLANMIKNNTRFKEKCCCIDLILTNRNYCFKNSSRFETGVTDHNHLKYSIPKTTFQKIQVEKITYRDYKKFSREVFKTDLEDK